MIHFESLLSLRSPGGRSRAALAAITILASGQARAAPSDPTAGGGGVSAIDTFVGAATYRIPIAVPAFHGIEPNLSLSYNSSGGNGWLGVGWALSGLGIIERTNPTSGAPVYDNARDGFRLDGEPLVACPATGSTSPSCLAGGNYSTRLESFKKIWFDAAANQWHVWQNNGTELRYAEIYWAGPGLANPSYKYGLTSVTDTHGNVVSYEWGVNFASCCWAYPTKVSYGGSAVQLYWEARPDVATHANGGPALEATPARIKTIEVRTQGLPVRAYQLSYRVSPVTGRSVLASVQERGRDYVLDGTGTVTGGTALPALTTTTQSAPSTFDPGSFTTQAAAAAWGDDLGWEVAQWMTSGTMVPLVGDFDGDGRSDSLIASARPSGGVTYFDVSLAGASGPGARWDSATPHHMLAAGTPTYGNFRFLTGDFNGDGKTDVLTYGDYYQGGDVFGGAFVVDYSTGAGFTTTVAPTQTARDIHAAYDSYISVTGDFNGDGKTDVATISPLCREAGGTPWATGIDVELANPGGVGFTSQRWPSATPAAMRAGGGDCGGYQVFTGDFNGDGKTDLLTVSQLVSAAGWSTSFAVDLSTGNGFASQRWASATLLPALFGAHADRFTLEVADVDGDGRTDVVALNPWASSAAWPSSYYVERSTGTGFTGAAWPSPTIAAMRAAIPQGNSLNTYKVVPGDFNGDGKTDLAIVSSYLAASNLVDLATGQGFASATWPSALPGRMRGDGCQNRLGHTADEYYQVFAADFDGDGRADLGARAIAACGLSPDAAVMGSPWHHQVGNTYPDTGVVVDRPTGGAATQGPQNAALLPDLVTRIDNGLGGSVALHYAPSSSWPGNANPGVLQTVDAVTQADGRGWASTTRYSYAGALYDPLDRQFLGFHYARTVLPQEPNEAAPPTREVWYHQGYGYVALPEREDVRSATGTLLRSIVHEYTAGTTSGTTDLSRPPFTLFATGTRTYDYDPANPASVKQRYVQRGFDAWGNLAFELDQGDVAVTGDETATYRVHYANPASFVTGLVGYEEVFAGTSSAGVRLAFTASYYDGHTSFTQPPGATAELTAVGHWLDTTGQQVISAGTYDATGNLIATTAPDGATTLVSYDASGLYPVRKTDALGHVTAVVWEPVCAAPSSVIDANNQETTFTYDVLCRRTAEHGPLGATRSYTYEGLGDPGSQRAMTYDTSADGVNAMSRGAYFDGLGRTYLAIEDLEPATGGRVRQLAYAARGQVAFRSLPSFAASTPATPVGDTTSYDALDRVISLTHPDGTSVTTQYVPWGAITTDEVGHKTADFHDARGNVVVHQEWQGGVRGADGRYTGGAPASLTRTYNLRGQLLQVVDATGNISRYTPDSLGRVTLRQDPDLGSWSFSYDAMGRELSRVDARGQLITTAWDPLGRKLRETDGAALDSRFAYDEAGHGAAVGRMTSMTDASGATSWSYDALGRTVAQTATIAGTAYSSAWAFDAGGRLLGVRYPDGDVEGCDPESCTAGQLTYDVGGRPASVPGIVASVTYNASGMPVTYANANATTTRFTYDANRQFGTSLETTGPGGEPLQRLSFTRDARGQLTAVASPYADWQWSFSLDEVGRLTQAQTAATTETFSYDAGGNLTSHNGAPYAYAGPQPHAVTTALGATYAYDANGNLVTRKPGDRTDRTLRWDTMNRPVEIVTSTGTTRLIYNGLGQRVMKVSPRGTTIYVGDGYEVTAGVATKIYALGDRPVAQKIGGIVTWLHADQLGSVTARSDATGTLIDRQAYTPYGAVRTGGVGSPIGFTGERSDPETGLVFLHARYYDPALGRFISADPTVPTSDLVGKNHYQYANNNPIDFQDRLGLAAVASNDAFAHQQQVVPLDVVQVKRSIEAQFKNVTIDLGGVYYRDRSFTSIGWTADQLKAIWGGLIDLLNALTVAAHGNSTLGWKAFNATLGQVTFAHKPGPSDYKVSGETFGPVGHRIISFLTGGVTATGVDSGSYAFHLWSLRQSTVHELGHVVDGSLFEQGHGRLESVTGGHSFGKLYFPGGQTTDYGRTGAHEDFADSFATYTYHLLGIPYDTVDQTRMTFMTGVYSTLLYGTPLP